MRLRGNASHIATILVLQAAGVGLASPTVIITPSVLNLSDAQGSAEQSRKLSLDVTAKATKTIFEWLPKDNQTTYIMKPGEIKRLELNSSELQDAPLIITVSPCTRNLVWSVYHATKNNSSEGWLLVREYLDGEAATFASKVSSNDRYLLQMGGAGGAGAAAAVWARGEPGAGGRLRLRARSKRRLATNWDQSPIDPQATTYCVVASSVRSYASLCAARHDCRAAVCPGGDCSAEVECHASALHNTAGEPYMGFKNYVRRKKYSRSTKLTDSEPLVACVGSRTHHIIENVDLTKSYHVSVFATGRTRGAGVLLAAGKVSPRARSTARPLGDSGAPARAELKGGKVLFYYKTKPYSDGIWVGSVTCGAAIDIEVSVKGTRIYSVRNIGTSAKFFVPASIASSSAQSFEDSYSFSSSSEEVRQRYVIKVSLSRGRSMDFDTIVEVSASSNLQDITIPELQPQGGNIVRELRPMRSCSSLHIAFLPARQLDDLLRYCVKAQEINDEGRAPTSTCLNLSNETNAWHHCKDQISLNQKVITESIRNLKPGKKYAVMVTAVYRESLPARYSTLYAETDTICK